MRFPSCSWSNISFLGPYVVELENSVDIPIFYLIPGVEMLAKVGQGNTISWKNPLPLIMFQTLCSLTTLLTAQKY